MTPADATIITMATVFGIALAIALIAAVVWSVIWVGKDARSRGITFCFSKSK